MEKNGSLFGRILVTIAFLLVLASITYFDSVILVILVALFVIAFLKKEEQENLLSLLEAVYVVLVFQIILTVVYALQSVVRQIIIWARGNPGGVVNDIFSVISFLITLGFAFVVVMALINALGKRPTKTLFVSNLALKSFGLFVPQPVNYYQAQQPYDPTANQQYVPQQPAEQAENTYVQQDSAAWTCSCGRTNAGKFCASCGKPKS